jgi:acyl carrier protein
MSLANLDTTQIASQLTGSVFPRYLKGRDAPAIRGDDDLLDIFDSLEVIRMTVDLEALFHIRIRNDELNAANIGTLDRLTRFISGKMSRRA